MKDGELSLAGQRDKSTCKKGSIKRRTKNFIKSVNSPVMSLLNPVHFEMNGNKEVVIEGCKSILEYDENMVRIRVKNMSVSYYGRNLMIKCLTPDSLVIEGFITSIEFVT